MNTLGVALDESPVVSRRELIAGLLMASAAVVVATRKPNIVLNYMGKDNLEHVVPQRIGRWKLVSNSGLVVPPADQLRDALYSQLLTRVYSDGSEAPIMLLVAYSANETGFLQVHRPEFCYAAAGFTLSASRPHEVRLSPTNSFRANRLDATRDGQVEKLLYWTRIGHHIPLSWAQQKLIMAEENLERFIPDAALIRISTTLPDEAQAVANMDEFARAMIASVPAQLRRAFVV